MRETEYLRDKPNKVTVFLMIDPSLCWNDHG